MSRAVERRLPPAFFARRNGCVEFRTGRVGQANEAVDTVRRAEAQRVLQTSRWRPEVHGSRSSHDSCRTRIVAFSPSRPRSTSAE